VGNTNPEYEKSIALYQGRVDRAEFPSPAASRIVARVIILAVFANPQPTNMFDA
jgi:hypothetical protein